MADLAPTDGFLLATCPICSQDLWLYCGDGRRVTASCWTTGCTSTMVLAALRELAASGGIHEAVEA